jgi:FecR protein
MDKVQLLISRYFDDDLSDDEILELATILRVDVESVDRLVFNGFIHAQLQNWMLAPTEQFSDSTFAMLNRIAEFANDARPSPRSTIAQFSGNRRSQHSPNTRRKRPWAIAAIAAAILVASTVATLGYVALSRPSIVGQITDATNCSWGAGSTDISAGTLLEKGRQLNLQQGRAVITFASGAKLLLEGPTSIHLNSPNGLELVDGRIAAKVPRQAIGFSVTSSLARIVDLGTEFGLALKADDSFELHVFAGQVELQLDKKFGETVHKPARIAAVHAVSFNTKSSDIAIIPFEPGKQMPF